MFRSSSSLGFPRRIVTYYLLFCMLAVSWLTAGVLFTAHTILESRATSACLAGLGKTAAAIEIDYLRHGPNRLQADVVQTCDENHLLACSIVAPDGTYLAHSNQEMVGQSAETPPGAQLRWGNVSESRFLDDKERTVSLFRVPLVVDNNHFGTLQMAVQQLSMWGTLSQVAQVAPLTVLVPLSIVAVGALVLARLSNPMADIDRQLRGVARSSALTCPELKPLRPNHAVSLGWNRVVDKLHDRAEEDSGEQLNGRLAEAIDSRRHNELEGVLQKLSEGIAVTDVEGRITFANRAVAALIGLDTTLEELEGIELTGNLLKHAAQESAQSLVESDSLQRPTVSEISRTQGARERVLRVSRSPLDGPPARGHVWSVRDVTQQKLSEKMRDQFIDAATHELRTPLSNIMAYSETLAVSESIDVAQQKEFCNIINSEVTRLARFVDDLLSISSMESGSLTIDPQQTDSARMFAEVISKVEPVMKQKSIEFETQLPEKMRELHLDKDKMVAVLVNLLGNAAKYTATGGRVSMRVKLDDRILQVAVEDTGVGIAAEEVPKVFDKFFRSSDERVQAETGTGLGLALAQEVVRMHGGDITVESQLDQGTTFTVTVLAK